MAKEKLTPAIIDDTRETVHTFLDKISLAQLNDEEWVETTPEIIRHYNRKGLNGSEYFIHSGIKVCEIGQSARLQAECEKQIQNVTDTPVKPEATA